MDNQNPQENQEPVGQEEQDNAEWSDNSSSMEPAEEPAEEPAPQVVSQQILVQEEESKLDPSWRMKDQITHCSHYFRYCTKLAPCCGIFYSCRLCHDENYKGPKAPGCKVETLQRQAVSVIKCKRCDTEQPPSSECVNCHIVFGMYYCAVCKFWDDDKRKEGDIYHCDKCNMCRRGSKENMYHCENCNVCLPNSVPHKCTQQAFHQNCPVCQENLFNSVKGVVQIGSCQHWMHKHCYMQYLKSGVNRCPVCNTVLKKMSPQEIQHIDLFVEETKDKLPTEFAGMKVEFQCLECHRESKDVDFHFYLKCQHCGTYNTKM